jgi:hypothetical protein
MTRGLAKRLKSNAGLAGISVNNTADSMQRMA